MRRDLELIRTILLTTDKAERPIDLDQLSTELGDPDAMVLIQHVSMLIDEAGYLKGIEAHTLSSKDWLDIDLTWAGHEFLDSIRDPEIWRKTKDGAQKAGQWSIKTIAEIAVQIGRARLEHLITTGQIL